ncbi:hypothetical protein RB195_003656 [Necator americanus]|uniref:G protein-coupled receptor n=1 Tax=Necator americanus TaxID=51031 RepID=A0ABR1DPT7_NECAM
MDTSPPTVQYNESDCREMRVISTSTHLLAVLFAQTIISIISLPLLIIAIRDVLRIALIHFNTKLIIIVYIGGLMVHSLSRITLHTTDLVVYLSSHESDCDMFPSFLRCLLMRIPLVASLTFVCTSNLMIAMERHVSTYKAKTYESNRSVGFLLVGLQAIIAGTLVFVMYSGTKFNLNTRLFYCLATAADHPFRTIAPISTLIILQFSAMIILKVTERENTKRSIEQRLNPDLKVRYNVGENLRTITIVIPFCYSCCFFTTLFTLVSCFVIFFNHIFEKPMYFALLEASLLLPVYSLMVPGLIRRMNRRVNQKNRSALQHHINSSKSVSVTSVYFDPSTWAWMNEREEEKTKAAHHEIDDVGVSLRKHRVRDVNSEH